MSGPQNVQTAATAAGTGSLTRAWDESHFMFLDTEMSHSRRWPLKTTPEVRQRLLPAWRKCATESESGECPLAESAL